jgi:hypothetical protein
MAFTEHTVKTRRHTTFYLAAGPEDGPLVIFLHGWPELSISWRNQLPALAEETIRSGHWLAQEKPLEVNAALVKWMATTIPDLWPKSK